MMWCHLDLSMTVWSQRQMHWIFHKFLLLFFLVLTKKRCFPSCLPPPLLLLYLVQIHHLLPPPLCRLHLYWRSSISIVATIQRNLILQSGSWVCFFAPTWSCPARANIMWSVSNVPGPIILVARTHLPIMLNQNIAIFLVSLNGLPRKRSLLRPRESRKTIVTASWFRCVAVNCHGPYVFDVSTSLFCSV